MSKAEEKARTFIKAFFGKDYFDPSGTTEYELVDDLAHTFSEYESRIEKLKSALIQVMGVEFIVDPKRTGAWMRAYSVIPVCEAALKEDSEQG